MDGLKKQIGPKQYDNLNAIAQDSGVYGRLRALYPDGRFNLLMKLLEHRKSIRKHATELAIKELIGTFESYTKKELEAAVKKSIESGYIGVFPKKERSSLAALRDRAEDNLSRLFSPARKTTAV